jgi:pyrimidine operon attenuation protein/uracil phosphoribosyltransferase
MTNIVSLDSISRRIYFIRGQRVMIDRDLAELYGVETRMLKQAVRRNLKRFPEDFMFILSTQEVSNWRSQFVISNSGDKMGRRHPPMAFTEQGVVMLSSVLNSDRAIRVNIQIMRTFTRLREMLAGHKYLQKKIEDMESTYDEQFRVVFEVIKQLLSEDDQPKRKIGF